MNTVAVRAQDYTIITYNRLLFGSLSLLTTLIACVLVRSESSLVAATVISMFVAATLTAWAKRADWVASFIRGIRRPIREWFHYYAIHWSVNLGNLALTLAFQITSIATLKLGDLANAWAVVVRIVGGFGTTAQQVIAPIYEIRFSKGLREKDFSGSLHAQRQAVITGCAFGIIMAATVVATLWVSGLAEEVDNHSRAALIIAATAYCGALGLPALVYRNLPLAGGRMLFLVWAVAKVAIGGLAFSALEHVPLLVVLVAIEGIFDPLFVVLTFGWLRKLRRISA